MRTLISDALIVNGDGHTAPAPGDVLVDGDIILHVGDVPESERSNADVVIRAGGKVLCPGFVDTHNHGALAGTHPGPTGLPMACEMSIQGGVTKRICGVDGLSPAPITKLYRDDYAAALVPLDGDVGPWSWTTLEEFYSWHSGRSATDLGMYLGHSAVRMSVMGNAPRLATADEVAAMAALVVKEAPSALGLSTGLVYNPAVYADQGEITALMRAFNTVKPGALFPHLRSESDGIEEALTECLSAAIAGGGAGGGYCNEHSKVAGPRNFDKIGGLEARLSDGAGSTRTMENMYPYTAGSTMGSAIFPPSIRAGRRDEFLARLSDPQVRRSVWQQVMHDTTTWDNFIDFCGGLGGIQIAGVGHQPDQVMLGRRLSDVAVAAGHADPTSFGAFEAVCDFFVRSALDVTIITHHGHDAIVERFFRRESMALCTDGLMPGPGQKPHPRVLGSFPRALRMAREFGIPLERICYRLSTLACRFLRLPDPVIRAGGDASLVLFDAETVTDCNTYEEPLIPNRGVHDVWIHGVRMLADTVLQMPAQLPGRILR